MAGLQDLFTALNNIAQNLGRLVAQTSLSIVVPVNSGGTGQTTLTAHSVLVGEGVNPVSQIGPGTNGQMLLGVTGSDPIWGGSPTITGGTISGVTSASVATLTGSTSVSSPLVQAGSSGTAGTLDVFPGTASKGKTELTAADNSGNTTTTIHTAAQAGARTYTIPDEGA